MEPFLNPYTGVAETVRAAVEPLLVEQGFELVQMRLVRGQRKSQVRLFIDTADASTSIGLEQLERLNRMLGDLLDVEDAHQKLFNAAWDLEVSSPGVDRPLAKKSHFSAAVGQRIKLKSRRAGPDGRRTFTGVLESVGEDGPVLRLEDAAEPHLVAWSDVEDAHVVFDFGQALKSKPKRSHPKAAKTAGKKAKAGKPSEADEADTAAEAGS